MKPAKFRRMMNRLSCVILCLLTVFVSANICDGDDLQDLARALASCIGLRNQEQYAEAIPYAKKALEIAQRLYGEENDEVASILEGLADLYHEISMYEKALPLFQQALEIFKQVHGEEHPKVAKSLNNLALLYHDMGMYEKALPLYQQALEIDKKLHGEEHPSVATTLNNLALLYE